MRKLDVHLARSPDDLILVGQLADLDRHIYFEYAPSFIATGLQLSPVKLPLRPGLIEHTDYTFGPLPGVFDDSLPDGWGLLLMDRHFRRQGIDPATLSPLDRLAYLGTRTMGALTYHARREGQRDDRLLDLHALGRNAEDLLAGGVAEVLPQLLRAGGSPGGARPKVVVGVKGDQLISGEDDLPGGYEHWIIKFAARADVRDAGPIEYAYAQMAKAAGIDMPEVRLFEVTQTRRYFGVWRFDRQPGNRRVHVHTFGNMVHANFRIPSTDYADLLKVTRGLTRNHQDVLRVYRRMAFNIAAHNRDDHAKNFAFMLNNDGEWSLTPAYDLTFSPGPGGEHMTTVLGEGRQPSREHCLVLADRFGIKPREAASIFDQINTAVTRWPDFAGEAGCTKKARTHIAEAIRPL